MRRLFVAITVFGLTISLAVSAGSGELVPFNAAIHTEPLVTGPCATGFLCLNITGTGTATHMGKIHIAGPSQVNLAAATQTGTSTLTAANGDSFTISFSGTVQFSGPNPDDPVSFQGTWTIIAGSGRFAAAAGSGSYSGTAAGAVGILFLKGTITSTGSNK